MSLLQTGVALFAIAAGTVVITDVVADRVDSSESVTVTRVIDGDTVEIDTGEHVRLIGIDTPERGECGYTRARRALTRMLEGERVVLENPGSVDDKDRYDRLLRYVDDTFGDDAGLEMIDRGLAVARYDSVDGYDEHPRESEYRAADVVTDAWCERRADDRAERWEKARRLARDAGIHRRAGESADELLRRASQVLRDRRQDPPSAPPATEPWQPPSGWTTDALTPGYTGCRQGYPGGRINGVYVWKPIAC